MILQPPAEPYELDDDRTRVDRDVLVGFLTTQAYWGRWRGPGTILDQLETAWRVVAVYAGHGPDAPMAGFARVVSDGSSVAYLADVFVLPEHRGRGLGRALVRAVVDDGPGRDFRWLLHTRDAHDLYAERGFRPGDEMFMERPRAFPAVPPGPEADDGDGDDEPATDWLADTRRSYDTVASSYADLLRDALDASPFERAVLALFAERVRQVAGPVADLGCGPGRLTAHLAGLGLDAFGVDLSPGMVEVARRDHPELRFEVGSLTDLALPDGSLGGALLWFSLVHLPDALVPVALAHVRRVLRPGGEVLVGFHLGEGRVLKTEGYGGLPMRVHVYRRRLGQVAASLQAAGLVVDVRMTHEPEEGVRGGFVLARRPA